MTINFEALKEVQRTISSYPNSELLVVTKNQCAEDILCLIKNNLKLFGENRIQEADNKFSKIDTYKNKIELHLIGQLQSNKTKKALLLFDCIQTIDRKKLIDEITKLNETLPEVRTKKYYIQINIGEEDQKSGAAPDKAKELYGYAVEKKMNIVGFMCIPPNNSDSASYFKKMLKLKNEINSNLLLSMGMSNDYKDALTNGSNLIRLGSMVFS